MDGSDAGSDDLSLDDGWCLDLSRNGPSALGQARCWNIANWTIGDRSRVKDGGGGDDQESSEYDEALHVE